MSFHVVIPARFASSRLPGKPLIDLGGETMIARVAKRALASSAASVVVATDDERIVQAVACTGAEAMLTRPDHPSGSDRAMEVAARRGWREDDIVVNVQGDEPLIPSAVIDQVAGLLQVPHGDCGVATLCEPIARAEDVFDPNIVKVVADRLGRALYFSRAPIPWSRSDFGDNRNRLPDGMHWQRHIGIYAYRIGVLREFVAWPPSPLETAEALEQLRLLEHGRHIAIAAAVTAVPGGVDTAADADRVRAVIAAQPPVSADSQAGI